MTESPVHGSVRNVVVVIVRCRVILKMSTTSLPSAKDGQSATGLPVRRLAPPSQTDP
jgi:hypothetical protein